MFCSKTLLFSARCSLYCLRRKYRSFQRCFFFAIFRITFFSVCVRVRFYLIICCCWRCCRCRCHCSIMWARRRSQQYCVFSSFLSGMPCNSSSNRFEFLQCARSRDFCCKKRIIKKRQKLSQRAGVCVCVWMSNCAESEVFVVIVSLLIGWYVSVFVCVSMCVQR